MKQVNQMYIHPRAGENHYSLDGLWAYTWSEQPVDSPELLTFKYHTRLPASVYWNLYESDLLPHPYVGCNSRAYTWADQHVWYFQKQFTVSEAMDLGRALLCFDGVAYSCEVWLNGHLLGDHNGMFGGPILEVSDFIRFGAENVITVAVFAATHPSRAPYANRDAGNTAIVPWNVTRDDESSNGDFIVMGLWRSVRIEFLPALHLARPYLFTRSVEEHAASLSLEVEVIQADYDEFSYPRDCESETYGYTFAYRDGLGDACKDESVELQVTLRHKGSGLTALEEKHSILLLDYSRLGIENEFRESNFVNLELLLPEPKLWNPVGLGDPYLYEVALVLVKDDTVTDEIRFDFGVRTVQLLPTAGKKMRSRWDNFQFNVNGRSFFLKGMNWMPLDFLYREDEREYRWILHTVKEAGIQLLRVWSGGGYPESEYFYRICNELGIMVWQDSFIANMDTPNYPQDELQEQLCLYLYRLRNHPSLVLHCGGNEFNPYSYGNAASMFVIERNVRDLDPGRAFKRTTPDRGSAHIYRDMEAVWYRLSYRQLPFVGESGIHSFPNAKSLKQLLSEDEYGLPINDMIQPGFRDSHPELLNHFTEYVPERVPRMLSRASAITDVSNADIETLALATQMASAEYYQIMIQGMRENYPVCGGIMPWVLKRPWTTVGIQLIDGLGEPIAPFYAVKSAYRPVDLLIGFTRLIFGPGESMNLPIRLIQENTDSFSLSGSVVKLEIFNDRLELLQQWDYSTHGAGSEFITEIAEPAYSIPSTYSERFFVVRLSLYQEGDMALQSIYWPKSLQRMSDVAYRTAYRSEARENIYFDRGPWLKDSVSTAEPAVLICEVVEVLPLKDFQRYRISIRNQTDVAAFPVSLQLAEDDSVQYSSDNYFFLPAGETREIILHCFDRTDSTRELTLLVSAWNTNQCRLPLNGQALL